MSRREERGSLKGKHSLFVGCCVNTLLHGLGGREVHLDLKKFGQAVLKPNHIQQRQFLFLIEFRDQIDVGRIVRFSSGHRTEHAEMEDTGGCQFGPVFAQLRDDLALVHDPILSYISALLNKIDPYGYRTGTVGGLDRTAPTDWYIDTHHSGSTLKKVAGGPVKPSFPTIRRRALFYAG